jgi:hypothetical protein
MHVISCITTSNACAAFTRAVDERPTTCTVPPSSHVILAEDGWEEKAVMNCLIVYLKWDMVKVVRLVYRENSARNWRIIGVDCICLPTSSNFPYANR